MECGKKGAFRDRTDLTSLGRRGNSPKNHSQLSSALEQIGGVFGTIFDISPGTGNKDLTAAVSFLHKFFE